MLPGEMAQPLRRPRAQTIYRQEAETTGKPASRYCTLARIVPSLADRHRPTRHRFRAWFTSQGRDPLQAALHGGDDYELLFAVPSRRRRQFLATARQARETSVTRVGVVEAGSGARLRSGTQESALSAGYEHFGSQGGTGAS